MIETLLGYIGKNATGKKVLLFFVSTVILATCIITMFFGHIVLDGNATMDSSDFYTSETFYNNLEIQGQSGRQAYLILHIFDYFFMASLAGFLIFAMYLLIKSITKTPRIYYLALIPVVYLAFDFLENLCIDLSLIIYPNRFIPFGILSGYFTTLKLMVLNMCFVLLSLLALISFVMVFIRMAKDKA